jgi:hypothetical protein
MKTTGDLAFEYISTTDRVLLSIDKLLRKL